MAVREVLARLGQSRDRQLAVRFLRIGGVGRRISRGDAEWGDCRWAHRRGLFAWASGIDPERVGLLGLSLGGAVAATLAPSLHAKALVLWSAVAHTARLRQLVEKSAKKIPGKPGAMELDAREFNPRLIEDVLKVEPIRQLARYKGPTLIIHPEKDETIPVSHARDFFSASTAEAKELVIIAGADHVYTSVPWEQEVIVRSVEWFGHHL